MDYGQQKRLNSSQNRPEMFLLKYNILVSTYAGPSEVWRLRFGTGRYLRLNLFFSVNLLNLLFTLHGNPIMDVVGAMRTINYHSIHTERNKARPVSYGNFHTEFINMDTHLSNAHRLPKGLALGYLAW